ncbi:MAG: class I SAM-dependent methyltransferase, partial [Steroidobacteraceae bacterium]
MSARLRTECASYVASHYWPDVKPGTSRNGMRCEDVESPTFGDHAFDIVIASDVFEHVFDIHRALKEIARVLTTDGVLIWTVPQQRDLETSRPRARRDGGSIEYLQPAEYHGDPANEDGVLVTFDWGQDAPSLVEEASGMTTAVFRIESKPLGILGEYIEVFVSCPSADGWAAGARREAELLAHERELVVHGQQ